MEFLYIEVWFTDQNSKPLEIMTQYNSLNVKLSDLQINKLKSATKNGIEVILKLSSNVVGDSNDENNFPHKSQIVPHSVRNSPRQSANAEAFAEAYLRFLKKCRGN